MRFCFGLLYFEHRDIFRPDDMDHASGTVDFQEE